ncbi:MAG TPA: CBS domain-containing protein [Planctomycetota bacterium]|nr:CBS domain-containing protein [Planctomycetota bacterium]
MTSTDLFAALRRDVDLQQPLQTIATLKVQCLGAFEPVERAVEIMRRRDVKHVMVTDTDDRIVGIVSMKDILKLILTASPKLAPDLG